MSDEITKAIVTPSGLGKDGLGNVDDKRIAGWVSLGIAAVIAVLGMVFPSGAAIASNLVYGFLGSSTLLFGVSGFEKVMK